MKQMNLWSAGLVAPWLLAASLPAVAVTTTYNWDTAGCNTSSTSLTCTDPSNPLGGPNLTYTAISDTGGTPSSKLLSSAYVVNYDTSVGHLGVYSLAGQQGAGETVGSSPNHALDNEINQEFVLLSFTSAITLTQVKLGWSQNDSDITVLAYTGGAGNGNSATPNLMTTGATSYTGSTGLVAKGWTWIGNYLDVCAAGNGGTCSAGSGLGTATVNTGLNTAGTAVTSSYWLVGAGANTGFVGSTKSGIDGNLDYVKLLGIAGTQTTGSGSGSGVPEPSSLLLMGIALASLTMLRRRGAI